MHAMHHRVVQWTALLMALPGAYPAMAQTEYTIIKTVGEADAPEELVFGEIVDLTVAPDHTLFLLDGQTNSIVVFDSTGEYVSTIGRSGQGPGELRSARALEFSDGELLALDPQNARINRYALLNDRWRYVGEWRLDLRARDFCRVRNRLFVLAASDGHHLHEYRISDRLVLERSAGTPKSNHSMMNRLYLDGRVHCDESQNRIVASSQLTPLVSVFSMSDLTEQTFTIPDFEALGITPHGDAAVQFGRRPDGPNWYDRVTAALSIVDGGIQIYVQREEETGLRSSVSVRQLDLVRTDWSSDSIPFRPVIAIQDTVWGIQTDPWPRVVIAVRSQ